MLAALGGAWWMGAARVRAVLAHSSRAAASVGATEQVAGQVATTAEAPCTQVRMLPAMLCGQDAAAEHPVPGTS